MLSASQMLPFGHSTGRLKNGVWGERVTLRGCLGIGRHMLGLEAQGSGYAESQHTGNVHKLKPGHEEVGPRGWSWGWGGGQYHPEAEMTKRAGRGKHETSLSTKSGSMIVSLKSGNREFLSLLASGEVSGEMVGLEEGTQGVATFLTQQR